MAIKWMPYIEELESNNYWWMLDQDIYQCSNCNSSSSNPYKICPNCKNEMKYILEPLLEEIK